MDSSNDTQDTGADCSGELSNTEIIILTVLNIIIGLVSVWGNAIILAAIYHVHSLRTVSNAFIGSMAVADFFVGLIMNPLWVSKSVMNIWKSDNQLSTAIEFLTMLLIFATTLGLCVVTVDRYIAVIMTFRYSEVVTWDRTRIVIFCIWLLSIFFACIRPLVSNPSDLPKLWIAATIMTVITPLVIISTCYCFIFKAVRYQLKRIYAEETINADEVSLQLKNRKAAFTIAIIVAVFTVCWTPSLVISMVQFFTSDSCKILKLNGLWFWGALAEFSNSALNPFVYCIRSRRFRKAMKRGFACHS